jgi:cell division protein FtsB
MKKIGIIIVIILFIFIIHNIIQQIENLIKNGSASSNLTQQYQQAKTKNEFLTQQLYYVNNDQYVEKQAREKLGYTKKGEYIVLVPSPSPAQKQQKDLEKQNTWKQWWDLFIY